MATIKRNPHGPQMTPSQVISVQTAIQTPQPEDGPVVSEGVQMDPYIPPKLREAPKGLQMDGGKLFWVPLDKDRDGNPWSYICEEREMKIAVNMRAERGPVRSRKEWCFFRMGQCLARSMNLTELFQLAETK